MPLRSSDKKLFLISALVIIGRTILVVVASYLPFVVFFDYSMPVERLAIAFAISAAILLCAARLSNGYLWLLDVLVQCMAVATVVLVAAIVRVCVGRTPYSVTSSEAITVVVSLLGFGLSVSWLRRKRPKW